MTDTFGGTADAARSFAGSFAMEGIAIAVLDARAHVVLWTQAAEELSGYPAGEVMRRPAWHLLVDRQAVGRAAAEWRGGTREGWAGSAVVRHRDGHHLLLGIWVWPMPGLAGECSWLLAAVDVGDSPWWQVNRFMLERFFERCPVGIAVLDPNLGFLWVNAALERLGGVPLQARLGKRLGQVQPGLDAEAIESRMRQVLADGQPIVDYEYRGRTEAHAERWHTYSTSFFRLDDSAGRVLGVAYMVLDITDRWLARERLALLNEVGARIGSTLDVLCTAQKLTEICVPRLADFATIDLLETVAVTDSSGPAPPAATPRLLRVGQHSVHPGCPESTAVIGQAIGLDASSPDARCLYEGRSYLDTAPDVATSAWIAADPARAAATEEFGLASLILVPLRARGETLGMCTFIRWNPREAFERDDLLLAEEIAARAAVSIDNAHRYSRQHATALALQRNLLPRRIRSSTTLEVAHRYLPARSADGLGVGGDWFDVIPLSAARTALVVGDVVGHGIGAAAAMGRLRTAVRTLAELDLPPEEVLARLDDLVLCMIEEEQAEDPEAPSTTTGATCLYIVYDPVTATCTMARAGHPPPAITAPDGTAAFADLAAGPPLGLGGLPFEAGTFDIRDGSTLALYTDGLIETRTRDIDEGLTRLGTALVSPHTDLDDLAETILSAVLPGLPDDDVALLLARTHPLDQDHVASWDLPCDPAIVRHARSLAADRLAAWHLKELTFTTELIISELTTNAIRYATCPLRLRMIRHNNALTCELFDASSTTPRIRHPRATDEGGRGLFLIAQMAHRWGTRHTATGKIVWAEQNLQQQPGADSPRPPTRCRRH